MKIFKRLSDKIKRFECERCGYCCLSRYVLLRFDYKDWIRIIEYLQKNYNGILSIKCDCGCGEINRFKINSIEDIKKAYEDSMSELWKRLDYGRCPFIRKSNNGKFFCEIHHIKPKLCRGFKCDSSWDDNKRSYYEEDINDDEEIKIINHFEEDKVF